MIKHFYQTKKPFTRFISSSNISNMKSVLLKSFGGVEQLFDKWDEKIFLIYFRYIGETVKPKLNPEGLIIKVKAAGVNRADTLQRKGHYPPPKGESDILGLEMYNFYLIFYLLKLKVLGLLIKLAKV